MDCQGGLEATSAVVCYHLPLYLRFLPLLPLPGDLRRVNGMSLKILAGYVEKRYGALGVGVVAVKGQLGNLLSENNGETGLVQSSRDG